jgi:hypothetical protein
MRFVLLTQTMQKTTGFRSKAGITLSEVSTAESRLQIGWKEDIEV